MKLNHRFNFPLRRTKQGAGWAAWREETVEDRDNTSVSKGRYRPRRGLSGLKPSLAQIWTGLSLSQRCTWSFAFGYLLGLRKAFPSFTVLIIYDGLKVASWEHTGFKKTKQKKQSQSPAQLQQRAGRRMERGGPWQPWPVTRGGFLCGSDSTMKNRPGIKGKLFLKTTAPTVFTCPHTRPRAILFSETTQAKKKAARRRVKSTAAYCVCGGDAGTDAARRWRPFHDGSKLKTKQLYALIRHEIKGLIRRICCHICMFWMKWWIREM